MKSDRIYPFLVALLLLLLAGSGVLAYVFYQKLTQTPPQGATGGGDASATASSPDAGASPNGRPGAGSPTKLSDRSGGPSPGKDGGTGKWAMHTPPSTAVGHGPALAGWTPEDASPFAPGYLGMSLLFDEDCEEYGGEYSLLADGASLSTFLTPGNVCLDVQRPEVYVPQDTKKTYTVGQTTYDACGLERNVRLCYSLGEISPDAQGRAWNPLYAPTAHTKRPPSTLLEEWHAPFLDEDDNSAEAQRARAAGSANAAAPSAADADPLSPTRNAHFRSNNPNDWFSDLPAAATATYIDIRPDVDLHCYADQNRLEYVFTFWPGVDPMDVEFTYDDAKGIHRTGNDNLAIDYDCATLLQHRAYAYKFINDQAHEIPVTYAIRGNSVSLDMRNADIPAYQPPPSLGGRRMQPVVDYLSYLGGKGEDRGFAVAVDNQGNAYLAGTSTSPDFAPGQNARTKEDTDAFVTKIRLSDRKVIYTTFLGGRHDDRAFDIAADAAGNVYVCGETLSPDFATVTPPPGGVLGRAWDAFVVKLNPEGQIGDFAFRLGGRGDDRAFGIAVDSQTNLFVAGTTQSPDFPTTANTAGGGASDTIDAFLVKLAPGGRDLVYAMRFGGSGDDHAYGLALDRNGSAVIAGETTSQDLPLHEPAQDKHGGGKSDAFAAVFSADGTRLAMATYLGGKGEDRALGVDVDRAHTVFLAGETSSEDFPVKSAVQEKFAGGQWDAFLTRIDPVMHNVVYSTYLGGTGNDRAFTVAADAAGHPNVAGTTSSTNIPMVNPLQDTFGGGTWDAFAFSLGETPTDIRYLTYLGGKGDDAIFKLAIEAGHIVNFAGETTSEDLAVVEPLQSAHRGTNDVFAGRILSGPPASPPLRMVPAGGQPGGPAYDFYTSTYEIDNQQFVNFLNDAEANPASPRGTNVYIDAFGNAWMSPEMYAERDELFSIHDSRIVYDPTYPPGARYSVTPRPAQDGNSYAHHPVVGASWYGAVKFCNWITVAGGRGAQHRCYREGTHPEDWAPVTAPEKSWKQGIFTSRQRLDWLRYKGFRLPMDNCATVPPKDPVFFRVTNEEFADFLNDAEANPDSLRGSNVFVDVNGNAFYTPLSGATTGRIFSIRNSLLGYAPAATPGTRFTVMDTPDGVTPPYPQRPVSNVTWPGAMKYCNWLTLIDGMDPNERAYREGAKESDWSPATVSVENWNDSTFAERERDAWARLDGYHLPFISAAAATNFPPSAAPAQLTGSTNSWPNAFNEILKTAGWNGSTNTAFGFGRNAGTLNDANYLDNGVLARHDTTPIGFYNGTDHDGRFPTSTNDNLYGAYDITGNASEWVSDPGNAGSLADRAYYGGSWRFPLQPINQRNYVHPYFTENFMGFRVVTTAVSENMHVARIPFRLCICHYGTGPGCGRGEGTGDEEKDEDGKPKEKKGLPPGFPPLGEPGHPIGSPTPTRPPVTTTPRGGPGGGGEGGGGGPGTPPTTTRPVVIISPHDDGGSGQEHVAVCHSPNGNYNNRVTLMVPMAAVAAHLAHGDTLGPCPP